jgi:hypothetical protein
MREKMLKLPPEFHTGTPAERFKRLAQTLMTVPKKELDKNSAKLKTRTKAKKQNGSS